MSRNRLNASQIVAGIPLPFDTYDSDGRLLLRRGYVIESADQAERLIARGLYSLEGRPAGGGVSGGSVNAQDTLWSAAQAPIRQRRISVHEMLDQLHQDLAALFARPPEDGSFVARLEAIARALQHACDLDSDAALARNLVVRLKPHVIRHSLDCAILIELLLRQTTPDASLRQPAVCAALTMNFGALGLHETCHHQQGPLSDEQARVMRAHPEQGAARLAHLGVDQPVWLEVVRQHHETADGSGYPQGLKADVLRPESQLLTTADRYCASVVERSYRPGKRPGVALQELLVGMGNQIDPRAASRLIREVGIHPPGALVLLASGELAMVVGRTLNAKHPVVRALTDSNGKTRPEPAKRMTSDERFAIKGAPPRSVQTPPIRLELMWYPVVVDEADEASHA